MIFQDDITKVSEDIESAKEANEKIVRVVESKLLTLNSDKSTYLVMGDEKARRVLIKRLEKDPQLLDGIPMKYSVTAKYLGSQLSKNLSESVSATVSKRISLASCSIFDIRSVVDDKRMEAVGSFSTAFIMYEMAVIPAILS